MSISYAAAIQQLENKFEEAEAKGITGSNAYERYLFEKGILPTTEELAKNDQFSYDWFIAMYYNHPDILENAPEEFVQMVLDNVIKHASNDEEMREIVSQYLASATKSGTKGKAVKASSRPEEPEGAF
ncbi:MAG: hypothetical protein LC687_04905 [Actinobacteria bacterium]|nr:hypothetical protein [Actinomycetota bacterium]